MYFKEMFSNAAFTLEHDLLQSPWCLDLPEQEFTPKRTQSLQQFALITN